LYTRMSVSSTVPVTSSVKVPVPKSMTTCDWYTPGRVASSLSTSVPNDPAAMVVGLLTIENFGLLTVIVLMVSAAAPWLSMLKVFSRSLFLSVLPRSIASPLLSGLPELLSPSFTTGMPGAAQENELALVATPPGVVTVMTPVEPEPTVASMALADSTLKVFAGVPPNATAVAPVKLVPLIVTTVPSPPLGGSKLVIVGISAKVNPGNVPVPPPVVTDTLPEAPVSTWASMRVSETIRKALALVPPKLTVVAPVKLTPLMVTMSPVVAVVGVKEVMTGAGMKVKPARLAVPSGVETDTLPVDPAPTTASIVVADVTVKETAAVPPNVTDVVPVKLVPVMVTKEPAPLANGVNDVIVGGWR